MSTDTPEPTFAAAPSRDGRRSSWIAAFALVAAMAGPGAAVALAADAPDAPTRDLERRVHELEAALAELRAGGGNAADVAELERKIEVLAEEVEALKHGEAAAAPTVESRHGLGPAASKVYGVDRGVSLGGYGEILYENFDARREDGEPSGLTDRLDVLRAIVYVGYKFDDRWLFNSEIEFEHATTDGDGEVSVEFAYLDRLFRPSVNLRAGLVLIPVGFLNELHEPPTFLGTRRPFVEQRILPSTWREAGAGVFGETGTLTYRAYVTTSLDAVAGSSPAAEGFGPGGIRDGRSSGSKSAAEDFAVSGRIDWLPVPGLTVGGSLFTGDTGQGARTPDGEAIGGRTTVWDLHADFRFRGLQARALYARTTVADAALINEAQGLLGDASVGDSQYGAYAEVGYDVLARRGGRQALIPFLRHERFDTQHSVPTGYARDGANDVTVTTVGVSYKPIPNVAIKADWNRISNRADTGVDQIDAAIGFLF